MVAEPYEIRGPTANPVGRMPSEWTNFRRRMPQWEQLPRPVVLLLGLRQSRDRSLQGRNELIDLRVPHRR